MKQILITLMIVAGFTTASFAQASANATASASATIVTPISIAKVLDMEFGNVAVHASELGTVILATDGERTRTGGVTLPTVGGEVSAASFTVTGEIGYAYGISLPADGVTISDGSNTMELSDFVSLPSGTSGTLTAGSQTVLVGATLNVAGGQLAGTYTNGTVVSVTVVYN